MRTLIVLGLLAVLLVAPRPVGAALAQRNPVDIVLTAADVGSDFVLAGSAESLQFGIEVRTQRIIRGAGKHTFYVEPDGILAVRSVAAVLPDGEGADAAFEQLSRDLFRGTRAVPIPTIGDRSRAAIAWGEESFDTAAKIVLFRSGAVVGWVVVNTFEPPIHMDDIVPLAEIMAERARQ